MSKNLVYQVWYMTPEFFRDGGMGYDWCVKTACLPDPARLELTHVHLKDVEAPGLEAVFHAMQGEVWSPNGEARGLILSKGLAHTSMSVGDVVKAPDGKAWMVDRFGFKELG